jgi:hypothetical protein
VSSPTATDTPAAWYPDPSGRYERRYWDGAEWTPYVFAEGQQFVESETEFAARPAPLADDATMRWLLPIGRSGWAIAAGYAGLFAFLVFPAPIALVLGVVALFHLRRRRDLRGWGRAIFGTVVGALGTALLVVAIAGA